MGFLDGFLAKRDEFLAFFLGLENIVFSALFLSRVVLEKFNIYQELVAYILIQI